MSIVPNPIEPLLADYFIRQVLAAASGVVAVVGTRIAPAVDGFEPDSFLAQGAPEVGAWPYILFGPVADALQEPFVEMPVLQSEDHLVRCFSREDFAPTGQDFQEIAAAAIPALQVAFSGVSATPIDVTDSTGRAISGLVHGALLLPAVHRAVYGEVGQRVCEAGVNVRIFFN